MVPTAFFLEELGITLATLKRDLDYMKDRLHAPISWDRTRRGYRKDGNYLLAIPYSNDRELIMDILKYGGDVEVVSPQALRKRVAEELQRAYGRYIPK